MSDLIEPVGARLTLLNGPAFRAGLESATESLQAFNDEQERAATLADASQEMLLAAQKMDGRRSHHQFSPQPGEHPRAGCGRYEGLSGAEVARWPVSS